MTSLKTEILILDSGDEVVVECSLTTQDKKVFNERHSISKFGLGKTYEYINPEVAQTIGFLFYRISLNMGKYYANQHLPK